MVVATATHSCVGKAITVIHLLFGFQVLSYNVSSKENSERAPVIHSHYNPLNITFNGSPCILFWARRIMIKFQNRTQLDLTDKTFGVHATVDVADSNCSEENAM